MWMNEYEVDEVKDRWRDSREEVPNLYKGAKILDRLRNWTNGHSDGWAYWQKPSNAAGKLMDLLHEQHRSYDPKDLTDAELKKALSPIKAFLTKQGVDHALILEDPVPVTPPSDHYALALASSITDTHRDHGMQGLGFVRIAISGSTVVITDGDVRVTLNITTASVEPIHQ